MELNQLPEAEAQFHILVDHPGVDPISTEAPVAQLQLARVLAKEGRKDDAVKQYRTFLQLWKGADKDSSILKSAEAELSAIK
jgi:predicted negative regulator of RcsB-dependent stress response